VLECHERPHSGSNDEIITDTAAHFFTMLACAGILVPWCSE
jgi:hypothetical protein